MTNNKSIQVEINTVLNKCFITDSTYFEFPEDDLEIIIEMMKYIKKGRVMV